MSLHLKPHLCDPILGPGPALYTPAVWACTSQPFSLQLCTVPTPLSYLSLVVLRRYNLV